MKSVIRWRVTVSVLILVLIACTKDPLEPVPVVTPIPSVGIDEPLLLAASSVQSPTSSAQDQHTFDLSSISIVQSGEFNDIEVKYITNDLCDEDVSLFNFENNVWAELATGPSMACAPPGVTWYRTLSERNLVPTDYLGSGDQLSMRTWAQPTLRALKINAGYDPITLLPLDIDATGIHVLGSTIWLAASNLSRVTTRGVKLSDVATPMDPSEGLAYDGERFWALDETAGPDQVFRGITPQGVADKSFNGHDDFEVTRGMVCVDSLLWANRGGTELLGINLEASVTNNQITFTQRVYLTTYGAVAITHDGTDFYIAYSNSIKKVSMSGLELEDHPMTVGTVIDLAWVEGALWMLHTGPLGVNSGSKYVSKFDL
jgi:hypothetical protein